MQQWQSDFIQLALDSGALRFGEFTLKSGRISPYFFNLGCISSGAGLAHLGECYANVIEASPIRIDMLFGPAYKGIPLAAATAVALSKRGHDFPFAYDRKEAKDHGEGGMLVGAEPAGHIALIDDVMTAGTAIRKSIALLNQTGAKPVAAIVALDRQETGPDGTCTLKSLQSEGISVTALVTLADVLEFLGDQHAEHSEAIRAYREQYGVAA